jgi:kinesin family protein C1
MHSDALRKQLDELKEELSSAKLQAIVDSRNHEIAVDDLERKQRNDVEDIRGEHRREKDQIQRAASAEEENLRKQARDDIDRLSREHRDEFDRAQRDLKAELEEERSRRIRELQELTVQREIQLQDVAVDIGKKEREAEAVREQVRQLQTELDMEKTARANLQSKLSDMSETASELKNANREMKAQIDFLQSDNKQQSQQFADLHQRMQDAIEVAAEANAKLRAEETLRRKLHNQVQELKGNIRVFARVRPILGSDEEEPAKITFPDEKEDSKEVVIKGPETKSALGKSTSSKNAFSFDRVFGPSTANADVFDEISQLVQSALDGYNVCIFCYGQTGSGKTFTMSAADGMIPRAVRQIYDTAKGLEEKGWKYKMEGNFVEVYNETLNDLLGKAEDLDKKKHEIRHDTVNCKTTITDIATVELDSPDSVQEVLKRADGNRSVAATKANMRSSRSHSVFILTLHGENSITGEKSEGTLNLVDLAGSERLAHSQAEGARLKETQSINKSLSCLGDVIGALGNGEGGHVPYRNSKVSFARRPATLTMH